MVRHGAESLPPGLFRMLLRPRGFMPQRESLSLLCKLKALFKLAALLIRERRMLVRQASEQPTVRRSELEQRLLHALVPLRDL